MANSSIYAAFERMWQHVIIALGNKQPKITGVAGDFVVIDSNGDVTTKTIPSAEEASF